ncbi:hypothetical protein F183_A29090 [Bryobacterales bacterium F-183]|nr:hypothetical protein F183_A29090 [Bryobacterales bacterium F-183]
MVSNTPTRPVKESVDGKRVNQERARLLYEHASLGVAFTAVVCTCVVLLVGTSQQYGGQMWAWWCVMMAICLARLTAIRRWERSGNPNGVLGIRWFGAGILLQGLAWELMALVLFPVFPEEQRALVLMVMCALASGAITTLASSFWLAAGYATQMTLPPAILYMLADRTQNGSAVVFLTLSYLLMILHSARVNHEAVLRSIHAQESRQTLLAQMQQAYQDLAAAQVDLQNANQNLEQRIRERTSDLVKEVAERSRYAQELTRLASTDSLTGLSNRATFSSRLTACAKSAGAAGERLAVLFIDLDRFKEVNDVRGHDAGDLVLREVARRLASNLPEHAELARWGGDEFVVMAPRVKDETEAIEIANRLRSALWLPIPLAAEEVSIDGTVGIAMFPKHGRSDDDLIRAADVAMYSAKQEGRNRVRMFEQSLADDLASRHIVAQALRDAVSSGQLSLHFQPIVSTLTGRCETMEALLRWHHPDLGLIAPLDFIPMAERSGDIVGIGRWALVEACRAAAQWSGVPSPPAVAVNISAVQVLSGTLFDDVEFALRESKLPPSRLHLELTESLFAGDHQRISPAIEGLRRRGIRISIDDFGTGFSSLSYLQDLPVDTIKIDRTFINRMNRDSHAIVQAIVMVGRALSFEVIAEGVESENQWKELQALGVTQFQGYIVSRPIPGERVPNWLAASVQANRDLASLSERVRSGAPSGVHYREVVTARVEDDGYC